MGIYCHPIGGIENLIFTDLCYQGLRFWIILHFKFFILELFYFTSELNDKYNTRKGFLVGPGFSWGHCWLISKRFTIGVEIGAGILYMQDTKRPRSTDYTQDEYIYHSKRITVAPTKADVSFVYLF